MLLLSGALATFANAAESLRLAARVLLNINAASGNPGASTNYNPLQDSSVVRYYSVIN